MKIKKPLVLIIRDGWGVREASEGNATQSADTPVLDTLLSQYPSTTLDASGGPVGLPDGQMGNSEVGHLNIGAGRRVYQDFTRVTKSIHDGDFFDNEVLISAFGHAKKNNSSVHLAGLISDGGVHSHLEHVYGLLRLANKIGVKNVYVHAFLDGRDTSPTAGIKYIAELEKKMAEYTVGKIATITGRYYAMDRDNRWERVERAYRALVFSAGAKSNSATEAIAASYEKDVTDEFVEPIILTNTEGAPIASINSDDSVIFFNFRSDRAREITRTFIDRDFNEFQRKENLFPYYVCLTEYDAAFNVPVAFPTLFLNNIFSEVISAAGLIQLRIAETEKYAHVTFFFNGGIEEPFQGEDRCLIPSPKIATYDLEPQMSAYIVTEELLKRIESHTYDVIIVNYANPDMVGHTGKMDAVTKALEVVDECVGRVIEAVKAKGGRAIVTADHGNSDMMVDQVTGEPFTAHTTSPVHFILVDDDMKSVKLQQGSLADVAPTMLTLLDISIPEDMTGKNLIS